MISRLQTPALIQFSKNELAVISEISSETIIIARPRYGLKSLKISDFVKIFSDEKILPVLILRTTNKTP